MPIGIIKTLRNRGRSSDNINLVTILFEMSWRLPRPIHLKTEYIGP